MHWVTKSNNSPIECAQKSPSLHAMFLWHINVASCDQIVYRSVSLLWHVQKLMLSIIDIVWQFCFHNVYSFYTLCLILEILWVFWAHLTVLDVESSIKLQSPWFLEIKTIFLFIQFGFVARRMVESCQIVELKPM